MGSGLFWGILLLVIGASLIFKVVFNIELPIFRIVIAFILIYLGIRILIGNISNNGDKNDIIFTEKKISSLDQKNKEYNVIFGKGTFDFTDIDFSGNQPVAIEFNTVFGSSEVRLNKDIPVKIKGETVFANISMPNGNTTFFGETTYLGEQFEENQPYLYIEASAVFGNIEIKKY